MSEELSKQNNDVNNNGDENNLFKIIENVDTIVMKKYLANLVNYDVVPLDEEIDKKEIGEYLRFYKINSIVFENKENNQLKLSSVFHSIYNTNSSIITLVKSNGVKTDFYIGVKTFSETLHSSSEVLEKSIKGIFSGTSIEDIDNDEMKQIIEELSNENNIVSSCSSISGVRKIDIEDDNNSFTQGIEKLIDAMKGEEYSIIIISDPIVQNEIYSIKNDYEIIYSQLSTLKSSQLSFSTSESESVTNTITKSVSKGTSEALSKSHTTTGSVSIGGYFSPIKADLSQSFGLSISESSFESKQEAEAEAKGKQIGSSKTVQITSENKTITNILKEIDKQLERINECEDVGVWRSSAYFISEYAHTNRVVSSIYQSLIRGEGSSVETSAINLWTNDNENKKEVLNYVSKMHHPIFRLTDQPSNKLPLVSPAVVVSSLEMSIQSGFPQRSVAGIPVIRYTPFSREILSYDKMDNSNTINLGKIFHLGEEENTEVNLNIQSLASHTFITGSTGSGKSNTIYKMIKGLADKNINFLVIEPAKGEYKNVFGYRKDVCVFGTNPDYTELLRINPFSFNKSIHVLEHIDRLIDIFNVCWPMYAAMPAVLKEAVEKSYIDTGWDLDMSVNKYGDNIFPNFADVLNNLKKVIEFSDYSQEVKSNYIGSLVTRVRSLTNGIIGRILSSKEIDDNILFDKNVIIDLSNVYATETKSIIMAILIMKLSEYRTSSQAMNQKLKHVTILEEAHNILKRTSTEQVSESANLVGKSVEMLSNSIAEMRTYGEGFIIADQSPAMVDMSAIRNTNTKIILRLPEYSDRKMVGKAAGLNDDKIEELAKLHTGVAAVYQNNWIDSVLCKVEHYNIIEEGKSYKIEDKNFINNRISKSDVLKSLTPGQQVVKIVKGCYVKIAYFS